MGKKSLSDKKTGIPESTMDCLGQPAWEKIFDHPGGKNYVICTMPGFGKTSAVAKLAKKLVKSGKKVGWFTCDEADDNAEKLLHKIQNAENVAGMAPEDVLEGAFFIIDEMQKVPSVQDWDRVALELEDLGDEVTFLFLTEKKLPRFLAEQVESGKAVLLTEDDFRLTEGYDPAVIRGFCGWPFGVRKATEYLKTAKEKKDWHIILRDTGLRQVLDDIIWEPATERIRDLMVHMAHLKEFSWELCVAVMEEKVSRRDFETMILQKGICICTHDGEWYRFGDAFAAYFREYMQEHEKRGLYGRAAEWFKERGDYAQMTDYAVSGEQSAMLVSALEKHGASLLTGRIALGKMVNYLEKKNVSLTPEAAGIAAQYYYAVGDTGRMERCLNEADSHFGKENKYSIYRSLYRAFLHMEDDPAKYEKQILEVIFFLKEHSLPFPYLKDEDAKKLKVIRDKEFFDAEALDVFSFGGFRVIVKQDGKELSWRTRKGKELFAYLLDINGAAVERRKLIEILWPEEIPDNAVAMLHNMIYHIRKELSDYRLEKILVFEHKKYRLGIDGISCDSVLWSKLAAYVERKDIEELLRNEERFLIYPGRYLEDIDNIWVEEKREYYDQIYRKGCEILAEHFIRTGDSEKALKLYGNVLLTDPYSEETVIKMLELYGKRHDWRQLKKSYEDFKALLKKDLDLEVGGVITKIYQETLKKGGNSRGS